MKVFLFVIYFGIVVNIIFNYKKDKYSEDFIIRTIAVFFCFIFDSLIALVFSVNLDFIFSVIIYSVSFLFMSYEIIIIKRGVYANNIIYYDSIMYILISLIIIGFLIYFKKSVFILANHSSIYVPYAMGSILLILNMKSINNRLHVLFEQDKGEWFFKDK